MFWLLVLSTVFLGVCVIVFILTRDSFHASRSRSETLPTESPVNKSCNATTINTMMREKIPAPPPSHPATLLFGQHGKEADAFAETLARVKENPSLPNVVSKAYLCLEERDDGMDYLLTRHARIQGKTAQAPTREFSIGVTEKKEAPLEHEKEPLPAEPEQQGKET